MPLACSGKIFGFFYKVVTCKLYTVMVQYNIRPSVLQDSMENKEDICMKKRLLALLLCLTMLAGNLAIAESVEVEQPEVTEVTAIEEVTPPRCG